MPRIDHAAIWVADLEGARDFYLHWFGGHANGQYHNPRSGLRTYILSFDDGAHAPGRRGARLELMSRPDVAARPDAEMLGWAHISFALPDRAAVDDLATRARAAGVPVIDGPRQTGDGYYEAVLLDPEGNRVEIVAGDYSDEVAQRREA
ncbi:VOC family protein [Actinomyces ruminis]|uniref:Glyoxalase n=1 Tax=Actinomyces ruminis TaxID=1937003 RepID=A0ABX4MHY9_9ACTO|nr:VOC family protein [Actinomyces ruminis]PHP53814.1 glyoxalase [Actinomyces ruminis]